tara:strand:+ start:32 stop:517 length:486 start_codon:yes stop_codon:yes gene_type:complete
MNNFVIDFENLNLPMYSAILIAHIVISIVLSLLAFYIVIRSIFGLVKSLKFSTFIDYHIPVFVVALLYIELILGLILYSIHMSKLEDFINQANANDYFSSRFWAIEHTILMFFAIIFGHLGLVYAKNLINNKEKFKMNLMYFGLSFILIMISLIMNIPTNA